MELFVPEDWHLVDEDGFRFWRLKSDIAADSLGTSLPGEDELLIPAEMLTRAAKSALQKKKKMLLLKKSRYAAEIGQWEDLLRLAGQDFPPIAESVDSGFQTSRAKLDFFSDLYEKLLNEVENLEACVQVGKNLIVKLEAQVKAHAYKSLNSEFLELTTPVVSARKLHRILPELSRDEA